MERSGRIKRGIWVVGMSEGRLGNGTRRSEELREPAGHTGRPGWESTCERIQVL